MKNQIVTRGIVLTRTDFQEADRIITLLTPDHGKVRLMAKGVRRVKSKLAGGIELFSVSHVTFLTGRKDIGTLVSARLITHYGSIVKDINRTMLGYEILKRVNRMTEDAAGEEYFQLVEATLAGLDEIDVDEKLIEMWFTMQTLQISGHAPNLQTDTEGKPLVASKQYVFDHDAMAFRKQQSGTLSANHIKLLRLGVRANDPLMFRQVQDAEEYAAACLQLAKSIVRLHVRA